MGAGTITTAEQAERCIEAVAQFLVSPGLPIAALSVARAASMLAIPGALTPTELVHAHENGAKVVKIFPCGNAGGAKYLKSLKGRFPHATLIPTGGVKCFQRSRIHCRMSICAGHWRGTGGCGCPACRKSGEDHAGGAQGGQREGRPIAMKC